MRVRLLVLLICLFTVNACTYRGQVRQGIYQGAALTPKVNASVLLITDNHLAPEIVITDTDNSDLQSFRLQTQDGITAAVTDALGTLFTQANSGSVALQANYNFVAQVTVEAGLTRNNCEGELARWVVRREGLCTLVTLALHQPDGKEITQAKASRWREFRTPGFASSVRWFNRHTFIFSPVLTPVYMQSQGNALRKQFEDNLTEALEDIMSQLAQKRGLFGTHAPNKTSATAQNYVE